MACNLSLKELLTPISFTMQATAINEEVAIIDHAEPTKPNLGNPNQPRIKPADKNICIKAQTTVSFAGNCISPIPRRAAVKLPDSHTTKPPDKYTRQYAKDSSSNAPEPPSVTKSHSPKNRKTKKKISAPNNEIYKECHKSFSALFVLLAPRLLDIEEDTAPPNAPKAICCVSIIAGNANVIAAKGIMPS